MNVLKENDYLDVYNQLYKSIFERSEATAFHHCYSDHEMMTNEDEHSKHVLDKLNTFNCQDELKLFDLNDIITNETIHFLNNELNDYALTIQFQYHELNIEYCIMYIDNKKQYTIVINNHNNNNTLDFIICDSQNEFHEIKKILLNTFDTIDVKNIICENAFIKRFMNHVNMLN